MGRSGDDVDIGLNDDQIMQRWLARRIFRESEFAVVTRDGASTVGWVTGLDDRCVQLSTSPSGPTDEPRSVLVFWGFVARIEETGRRLDDLDYENRSKIRSYSHALKGRCEAELSGRPTRQRGVAGV